MLRGSSASTSAPKRPSPRTRAASPAWRLATIGNAALASRFRISAVDEPFPVRHQREQRRAGQPGEDIVSLAGEQHRIADAELPRLTSSETTQRRHRPIRRSSGEMAARASPTRRHRSAPQDSFAGAIRPMVSTIGGPPFLDASASADGARWRSCWRSICRLPLRRGLAAFHGSWNSRFSGARVRPGPFAAVGEAFTTMSTAAGNCGPADGRPISLPTGYICRTRLRVAGTRSDGPDCPSSTDRPATSLCRSVAASWPFATVRASRGRRRAIAEHHKPCRRNMISQFKPVRR